MAPANDHSRLFVRIPVGLVIGTLAFWVGFARLVTMSTGLMVSVMKGSHPYEAVDRLNRDRRAE